MYTKQLSLKRKIAFLDWAIDFYNNLPKQSFEKTIHAICILFCIEWYNTSDKNWKDANDEFFGLIKIKFSELYEEIQKSLTRQNNGIFLRWESKYYNVEGRLRLLKRVKGKLLK